MGKRAVAALTIGLVLTATVVWTISASSDDDSAQTRDTLVVAAEADPVLLDGAFVSDGPSARVIMQIQETLVRVDPRTGKLQPGLASSWSASQGGRTYTFDLRERVRFSDGTPFNAAAVCFNLDRQYQLPAILQGEATNYQWFTTFGGYAKPGNGNPGPDKSLYRGCEVVDDSTARVVLSRPSVSVLGSLALPNFAIASPTALTRYKADAGTVGEDGAFRPEGTFGTEHPVGTGPYKLESWKVGDRLVLVRNDDYWGSKAKLRRVIIRPITENTARMQALEAGEVDVIEALAVQDVPAVESNPDLQVLDRPPFNIAYVGINQARSPLDRREVREAIAYGLDRDAVVKAVYGSRASVANQFLPPDVDGYVDSGLPAFQFEPERSKRLLREAGLSLPVDLDFWYPTDVTRDYMPDPQRTFQAFAASLNKAGFNVKPKPASWRGEYLSGVLSGKASIYLLGWVGGFVDPAAFFGPHFAAKNSFFGFRDERLFELVERADQETDPEERTSLYQQAGSAVMDNLPMVPYANATPALAARRAVNGYVPSQIGLDEFAPVSFR